MEVSEKKIFKTLDFMLKAIPVSMAIFLVLNFIFNLGYFSTIGMKFVSLLEIRDYYEGTAPQVVFVLFFFLGYMNIILYSKPIQNVFCNLQLIFDISVRAVFLRLRYRKLIRKYKKMLYENKREVVRIKKRIEKFSKYNIKEILVSILLFVLLIVIILLPIFQSYIKIFNFSQEIFWILLGAYLILVGVYLFSKSSVVKIIASVLIIPFMLLLLAHWAFLRDYKTSGTEVLLNDGSRYILLRPISKGVLLKKDKALLFYSWDKVDHIIKEADVEIHF